MAQRIRHTIGFLNGGSDIHYPRIKILGIEGLQYWPKNDTVIHVEPNTDVILSIENFENTAVANLDVYNQVEIFEEINGEIVIPQDKFTDILHKRGQLSVTSNSEKFGGSLIFLPNSETETYINRLILNNKGEVQQRSGTVCTDFIDVSNVVDIVISGAFLDSQWCVAYAYNNNKEPMGILLPGGTTYVNRHITPDGSYRYIRCSSNAVDTHECKLYFRDRRS